MHGATIETTIRGVSLAAAQKRLDQISAIARRSSLDDAICRHWSADRFDGIESLARELLRKPPVDLSAMAMDLLQLLRMALRSDMSRFSDLLEDVHDKPDWRVAYLSYFVPFALAVLADVCDKNIAAAS